MKQLFKRVLIIGIGLVGGSVALGFRKNQVADCIVGIDVNRDSLELAKSLGAIDEGYTDLRETETSSFDLILIATPVQRSIEVLRELGQRNLLDGCIITDVSGTKLNLQKVADDVLPSSVHFIGGHPMAGSHRTGMEAASSLLFENAVYVLTRSNQKGQEESPDEAEHLLQEAIGRLGAQVMWLEASLHDQVVAAISHVPHIIAAQLVDLVADLSQDSPYYVRLAAGGFRDVTRIAAGSPELWRDIVRTNALPVAELLKNWLQRTNDFLYWIEQGDDHSITEFFERARDFREQFPVKAKGAIRQYFDLTVHVPDEPGVIGRIASLLGEKGIGLKNIGILESREGQFGQLQLSFATQTDWEQGQRLLENDGYSVFAGE